MAPYDMGQGYGIPPAQYGVMQGYPMAGTECWDRFIMAKCVYYR